MMYDLKTQYEIRRQELFPLHQAMDNDSVIRQIAERYMHGETATLTECLFQMVARAIITRTQMMDTLMLQARVSGLSAQMINSSQLIPSDKPVCK